MVQLLLGASVAEIYVTNERHSVMATASSSSDPAYVPIFVEALADAGVRIGLPPDVAQESLIQTVPGSTRSVERADEHPVDLRNMATSPGEQQPLRLERVGSVLSLSRL